jgi:hypothetical protein
MKDWAEALIVAAFIVGLVLWGAYTLFWIWL